MSRNIGIVCEGPTDYLLLKGVIEAISEIEIHCYQLQPEGDLTGQYGNGWKGVWKWCADHAEILQSFMKEISPRLDLLIIQMDGDVARREKEAHCKCDSVKCTEKQNTSPLECKKIKEQNCPVTLPCSMHEQSAKGYCLHLEELLISILKCPEELCFVIPCDSTDAWIVAAYDEVEDVEKIENPWENIISIKKEYHGIRIHGHKKHMIAYRELIKEVCRNWDKVTELCYAADRFNENIRRYLSEE